MVGESRKYRSEDTCTTGASVFPASFAQQRLWFLSRMAPDTPFYNVSTAVRIQDAVDSRVLRRALDALVERHEPLRTTFALIEGDVCQVIGPPFSIDLDVIDLRRLPQDERDPRTADLVTRAAERCFELENGPLIRCTLIQRGTFDHVLALVLHHIVCDGWSLGVLGRELTELYRAFALGRPDPLPKLPIQYVDFAVWQREQMRGALLREQLAFWRPKLRELPVLNLPTDRPRPSVLAFAGAMHAVRLSATLSASVRQAARQYGATPYMVMLAGFASLLARCSGQNDIPVGAPVAGRTRPELEPLIGFFVNSVVLRIDAAGDPDLAELIARVRGTVLDALAHQEVPFERLVEDLRPPRDPSRNPFFQVTFQVVNLPTLSEPGADDQQPVEIGHHTAIFDLAFTLIDRPQGFFGGIEYSTELFDAATIAAFDRQFQTLLANALAAPGTPLSRLALDDRETRDGLLAAASGPALAVPQFSVVAAIEAQALQQPDAVAIRVPGGEDVRYGDLRARWLRLAARLNSLGVGPEVPVGVCMQRSADSVVAMLAVLAAGGVYVPLDPSYPDSRLRVMAADAAVRIAVTHVRHTAPHGPLAACAAQLVLVDADQSWPDDRPPAPPIAPANLAYVIYTSGSTGTPNGVAVSHSSLANHMAWIQLAFPLTADDRFLHRTPACFDASVWEVLAPLMAGARLVLLPSDADRDPALILRVVAAERVSVLQLVPALLRTLAGTPDLAACTSLRRIFCGGEALPADVAQRVHAVSAADVINLYGPTETTIDATAHLWDATATPSRVPIGRPIANTVAYVLDQSLQLTAAGLEGELHIGGAGLARGYLGRPALTAARFIPDPLSTQPGARLYRSGDRVRMLPDGNLLFVNRADRQIKLRGFRIEPAEVEHIVRKVNGVADCAVVLDSSGAAINLFIVPRPESREEAGARRHAEGALLGRIRRTLSASLPQYMVPSRFVSLDSLPRSPNGKLDHTALNAHLGARPETESGYVAPRTALEEALAMIWAATLGLDRVGILDGFFSDLGGHSLFAAQLVTRIREALRIEVPLRQIFVEQTIEGFAARLIDCPAEDRLALERTAELYVRLSRMSDDEVNLALAAAPVGEC
jgi:amino acid adenylation domain-containing protein